MRLALSRGRSSWKCLDQVVISYHTIVNFAVFICYSGTHSAAFVFPSLGKVQGFAFD